MLLSIASVRHAILIFSAKYSVKMDTTVLLLGVLFSSIGLGYFIYGKKQHHSMALICGIVLMIYPYFIDNIALLIGVGLVLMTIPKWLKR